jgi:hypothetical protein
LAHVTEFSESDESEDTQQLETRRAADKVANLLCGRPHTTINIRPEALAAFLAAANNFDVRGMFRACENDGLSPVC